MQIRVVAESNVPSRRISGVTVGESFIARDQDDRGAFVKVKARAEAANDQGLPPRARARWYLYHAGKRTLVCDGTNGGAVGEIENGKVIKRRDNVRCSDLTLKLYPTSPSKPPILNEYALGLIIEDDDVASSEAMIPFFISFPMAG